MKEKAQQFIYLLLGPLINLLIRLRVSPNMITAAGFLINIAAAAVMVRGGNPEYRNDLSTLGWFGGLVLFAGLFDMIDGRLARVGRMESRYGALFDSVVDRYSELVMFLGICYFLVAHQYFISSLIAFLAMIGSLMVSYVRARAEGLGIECKSGLMQRPERIVILGVSALACGIVAEFTGGNHRVYTDLFPFAIVETISIFIYPLALVAVMSNLTAYNRLIHCKHELEKK